MLEDIRKIELQNIDDTIRVIQEEIDRIGKEKDSMPVPDGKFTWIGKNITKRKQYKKDRLDYWKAIKDMNERQANLLVDKKKVEKTRSTIKNMTNPKEIGINSIQKLIQYNREHSINFTYSEIISLYPEEAISNITFFEEAIEKEPQTIIYDKSNNIELYKKIITKLLDLFKQGMNSDSETMTYEANIQSITWLLEKLNDHEFTNNNLDFINYVFEYLRFYITKLGENAINLINFEKVYTLYESSFGKEMRQLYEREDVIVGMHGTSYYEKDNQIMKKGLKTSTQGGTINDLSRTVAYGLPLLKLLTYRAFEYAGIKAGLNYNYIVVLPSTILQKNCKIPIWGSKEPTSTDNYLLPEYIYVLYYIRDDNIVIQHNEGEKRSYPYLFENCSTTPVNSSQKTR